MSIDDIEAYLMSKEAPPFTCSFIWLAALGAQINVTSATFRRNRDGTAFSHTNTSSEFGGVPLPEKVYIQPVQGMFQTEIEIPGVWYSQMNLSEYVRSERFAIYGRAIARGERPLVERPYSMVVSPARWNEPSVISVFVNVGFGSEIEAISFSAHGGS